MAGQELVVFLSNRVVSAGADPPVIWERRAEVMAKGKHKVSFIAEVPTETKVQFRTRQGERVSFEALKDQPKKISFWAKNADKRK